MDEESPDAGVPAFMERCPPMTSDPATMAAFDCLFDQATGPTPIAFDLPVPRWQFIAHVIETRDVLVHGSARPDISVFEPRQPVDTTEFGNQRAVYAASDALWAMYFAILDRARHPMSMINSAARIETAKGLSEPHYFFSISRTARDAGAFTSGTIYFLPRASFVQQPPMELAGRRLHVAQWASLEPVIPLARIRVGPEDFPLLDRIRGHDDASVWDRVKADPDGFPWLD